MTITRIATAANVEDANADFDDATSRIPSKTSVPPMQSQEDEYSIMTMEKYIDRLLTVFGDVEQEESKCTNLWRPTDFHVLVATAEAERYIDDDILTDSIFYNKATRIAYDTFIDTVLDDEKMTSLSCTARADAWMDNFI